MPCNHLVFMHIPKTAGVSIRALMGQYFAVDEIAHIEDPDKVLQEVEQNPSVAERLQQYRFIHGHISTSLLHRLASDRSHTAVFLRDPVARVISTYYFWRDQPLDEVTTGPTGRHQVALAKELTLDQFVRSTDRYIHGAVRNRMVKMLSAHRDRTAGREKLPMRDRLEVAKAELDGFSVLGLTEAMDASMAILTSKLGWCPTNNAPRLNVSRHAEQDVDPEVVEYLREANVLDTELYEYAAERLQKESDRLAGMDLIAKFESDFCRWYPDPFHTVDMRGPLIGAGWYERETDSVRWWRWSGPKREAVLYFRIAEPRHTRLVVRIVHVLTEATLEELVLRVNGRSVPAEIRRTNDGAFALEARLPSAVLADKGFARVTINTPVAAPRDVLPGHSDTRYVGVAVEWAKLIA